MRGCYKWKKISKACITKPDEEQNHIVVKTNIEDDVKAVETNMSTELSLNI